MASSQVTMESTSLPDYRERVRKAFEPSLRALRDLAAYDLPGDLQNRMLELGESGELLKNDECRELQALAKFSQLMQIEKLKAMSALKQLEESVPELVES